MEEKIQTLTDLGLLNPAGWCRFATIAEMIAAYQKRNEAPRKRTNLNVDDFL